MMPNDLSRQYVWSDIVKVEPWVGKCFASPHNFQHKTLILGESNYTQPEKFGRKLVQECIRDDMSDNEDRDTTGFCRFSTKIRRVIFGEDEQLGPEKFWQDVAFYNFVQFLVGNKPGIPPAKEMWEDSVPVFYEIVTTLCPERILVLGFANWQNLLEHVDHDITKNSMTMLKIGGKTIKSGCIMHPSSPSFSYDECRPVAQSLLFS